MRLSSTATAHTGSYLSRRSFHTIRLVLIGAGLVVLFHIWHQPTPEQTSMIVTDAMEDSLSLREHTEDRIRTGVQLDGCGMSKGLVTVDDMGIWASPTLLPPERKTKHLKQRLRIWATAPVANQTHFTTFNQISCSESRVGRNGNRRHRLKSHEMWRNVDVPQVIAIRDELITVLMMAHDDQRFVRNVRGEKAGGRGIVFAIAGAEEYALVIRTLRLLRSYGTALESEVFHPHASPPNDEQETILLGLGATVRIVTGVSHQDAHSIKGASMVQSHFDELLYLDTDNIPVADVSPLFDSPGYAHLGAMFWPDYWKDSADNPIWSILGVQCRDEWSMESGQILINKKRHLDALILVEHMLKTPSFWFNFSDGDKDLPRYAFLAMRKRWAVPGRHVEAAGAVAPSASQFCGVSMVQYDAFGSPVFVHANSRQTNRGHPVASESWGQTQRLLLPATISAPSLAGSVPTFDSPLISTNSFQVSRIGKQDGNTTADQVANVNYVGLGIGLLAAPVLTRERAILERGLYAREESGACIDQVWRDWRGTEDIIEEVMEKDIFSEVEPEATCGIARIKFDWTTEEQHRLGIKLWEEDSVLRTFQSSWKALNGL